MARRVDGAPSVFCLAQQCSVLVGFVLCHIELTCDRYLHRVEAETIDLALGLIAGDSRTQHRRRSILVENEVESALSGALDRIRIASRHPKRGMWALRRRRLHNDIFEMPETALVRKPFARCPSAYHYFERLLETGLGLFGHDLEALEFTVAIAFANAKIESSSREKIEGGRVLCEQYWIVPRRHDHGRAKPQVRRSHCERSEQHQCRGNLIPSAEMMFDREARMKTERFCLDIKIQEFKKALTSFRTKSGLVGLRRTK